MFEMQGGFGKMRACANVEMRECRQSAIPLHPSPGLPVGLSAVAFAKAEAVFAKAGQSVKNCSA
jgi:hypothetical protein